MNKFVKVTAVTGLALSMGLTAVVPTISHAASTAGNVVYQDNYKTIKEFSKTDLEKMTGTTLTVKNVNAVYQKLQKANTWVNAGYTKAQASEIANRVSSYTYQIRGILTDIANNPVKKMSVTYISNNWTTQVNFGTRGEDSNSGNNNNGNNSGNEGNGNSTAPSVNKLNVKDLEVKVKYDHKEVKVEYEVKSDGRVKAEFKNEFTGQKVEGATAQKIVEDLFADMDMNSKNTTQIKNHVISKLKLKNNFEKFEYEVKYQNNTKFEFKIK